MELLHASDDDMPPLRYEKKAPVNNAKCRNIFLRAESFVCRESYVCTDVGSSGFLVLPAAALSPFNGHAVVSGFKPVKGQLNTQIND